jgi:hypothetical protein
MDRLMRWLDGVVEGLCNWLNDVVSGRRPLARLGYRLAGRHGGTPLPVDRRIGAEVLQMHQNQFTKANSASAKGGGYILQGNCGFWAYCHMSGQPCVWCGGSNALGSTSNRYAGHFSKAGEDLCPSFHGWGKSDIGSSYPNPRASRSEAYRPDSQGDLERLAKGAAGGGGVAWFGCCKDPYGKGKLIAFLDCCGSHVRPCSVNVFKEGPIRCKNWPEAKNWCTGEVIGQNVAGGPVYEGEHYYCTVVIDMNNDAACN